MKAISSSRIGKLLPLLVVLLSSCGVSHHFIPQRPLEKEDVRLMITWNYDFNNLTHFKLTPDVNAYYGLGKNYTIGMGAQFPFYVSHITGVKYLGVDSDDAWAVYSHLNRVFGVNSNPALEVGAQYSKEYGDVSQTVALGLAYGRRYPPPPPYGDSTYFASNNRKRLFPAFRWEVAGQDFGFSFYRYQGLSRDARADVMELIETANDTVYSVPVAKIDSVSDIRDSWSGLVRSRTGRYSVWGIFLSDGTEIAFNDYPPYGDVYPLPLFLMTSSEIASREIYRLGANPNFKIYHNRQLGFATMLNANDVRALMAKSDTLHINFLKEEVHQALPKRNWFLNDNSVAVSIIVDPKKRSKSR